MGTVNAANKPEAESFSYAYVQSADGKFVRVSVENMKIVLGIATSKEVSITLTTANWVASEDETYYTQEIAIAGSTSNTRVDLTPTPSQIIQLMHEEISMFVANEDGVIKAYCINGIPSINMTISAVVTEVI